MNFYEFLCSQLFCFVLFAKKDEQVKKEERKKLLKLRLRK